MRTGAPASAYASPGDLVRESFEADFFGSLLARLLPQPGEVLDLGCGDGMLGRQAGRRAKRYVGIDWRVADGDFPGELVLHDLNDGLGPVGARPFDVYAATFGLASHLSPAALERLLADIARHSQPGALVALEGLGLRSLEWPELWDARPGRGRIISYRLSADVQVHPWLPGELAGLYRDAGIEPLLALDRTLQAGPKLTGRSGWPGLPPLRTALGQLLGDRSGARSDDTALAALAAPLPPLPAGSAAVLHHELAAARQRLLKGRYDSPRSLAWSVWALEPATGGGFGHGITVIGRVR